jgi:hypothetical protein
LHASVTTGSTNSVICKEITSFSFQLWNGVTVFTLSISVYKTENKTYFGFI